VTALDDGNSKHYCVQLSRFDALDSGVGRCVAEASGARVAAERAADAVLELTASLTALRQQRERECDIRHVGLDREVRDIKIRVGRVEDHEDHEDDEPDTGVMSRDELVTDRHRLKDTHEVELRSERIKGIVAVSVAVCSLVTALGTVLLSR